MSLVCRTRFLVAQTFMRLIIYRFLAKKYDPNAIVSEELAIFRTPPLYEMAFTAFTEDGVSLGSVSGQRPQFSGLR